MHYYLINVLLANLHTLLNLGYKKWTLLLLSNLYLLISTNNSACAVIHTLFYITSNILINKYFESKKHYMI